VNWASRVAQYFLHSKLTPIVIFAIVVWGLFAMLTTPREENPQITRPAAIIVTRYPGASPQEVDRVLTQRGERVLREVPGVEHVYSISLQDVSYMTVLFHVGDDPTKAFVDLYDRVFANLGDLPPGASQPVITPMSTDDIPIVVLTLHGARYDRGQLDDAAQRLIRSIEAIDGVSTISTFGGRPRQVSVTLDPAKLSAFGLSPMAVERAIGATDVVDASGPVRQSGSELRVHAGLPFLSAGRVGDTIVGVRDGSPVALRDVAEVRPGIAALEDDTLFESQPAVNVAVAKKPGSNAVAVAGRIVAAVGQADLPPGMNVTVTRNYGDKANLAVNELIERLVEAIVIVVLLLLVLGWRQALVVATAIPLTLFVTLGIGALTHQTINRITLFALILALGLLVDDAIVMVENIHRHYTIDPQASRAHATVAAVGEIASPTALATVTVMLSFLPMLFVTGMMGPYMRPIPINVPVAMLTSLLVAVAITPWATYKMLHRAKMKEAHGLPRWVVPFRNALSSLLADAKKGNAFLIALLVAFAVSLALPALQLVQFRMLPRANETTFLVKIDALPSSTIAGTDAVAQAVGARLANTPEVANYEIFTGTNSVPDLSSLFTQTIFRTQPNQADIRVNLLPKDKRKKQSALIVRELRPALQAIAARYGAQLRIDQTPPGPPVRNTIFAKIYGPDPEVRRAIASRLETQLAGERGVVDVDPSDKQLPPALFVDVDARKAALSGVSVADVTRTLQMALDGASVATMRDPIDMRPEDVVVRFAPQYRSDPGSLASIFIPSASGSSVALSEIARVVPEQAPSPLYRDDYREATYVGAEMAGRSSTYAVIEAMLSPAARSLPAGYRIAWEGEWDMTLTVFADLGRAMAIAFLLIYFVLVARFRSLKTPLIVLAAVPLAMIGILPGFAILAPFGVYFSATAMIGLIALIGIVVRNSIILIEFVEDKRAAGMPLERALVEATATRTRPIFMTAAAGVLSSVVIAGDPVWSGLAWALIFGMSASAVLSVLAIPLLYSRIGESAEAAPDTPLLVNRLETAS
jgi:multidrug efflux pump subunit AcrB